MALEEPLRGSAAASMLPLAKHVKSAGLHLAAVSGIPCIGIVVSPGTLAEMPQTGPFYADPLLSRAAVTRVFVCCRSVL